MPFCIIKISIYSITSSNSLHANFPDCPPNDFLYYLLGCIRSWLWHARSLWHHAGSFIAVHDLAGYGAQASEPMGSVEWFWSMG